MIKFRQKEFSEADAMRSLYVEITKDPNWRKKYGIIDSTALPSVLRGNNVVIERFVISTSFAKRDRYRMYLKIGAKAKLPDTVRLPEIVRTKKIGEAKFQLSAGEFKKKDFSDSTSMPIFRQKEFGDNKSKKVPPNLSASLTPYIELSVEIRNLLGDAIKYDKKERSLVLEFNTIQDAIRALNILPFGLNYKIYLLNL